MKWLLACTSIALSALPALGAEAQTIDAHALAATGDTTADEALGRSTGAFANSGVLVLRAQRVQTVRLNGIEVPWLLTAERGWPLELVPVGVVGHAPQIVGGAQLYRTYDPSLPAILGAGVVELEPGVLPAVPTLELALGTGLHTSTTFQNGWSYDGGDLDWLGLDDGTRALPEGVPPFDPMPSNRDRDAALLASASDFSGTWQPDRMTALPDVAFAARLGNRYPLSFGALSVEAALYLRDAWRSRAGISHEVTLDNQTPLAISRLELEQTTYGARLAAALRVRLEYGGGGHVLELHTWLARGVDDTTSLGEGPNDSIGGDTTRSVELYWYERQLLAQQVVGEQRLGGEGAPTLRWHYALSMASRQDPDRRAYVELVEPPERLVTGRASRSFLDNSQLVHDVGLDLRVPLLASQARSLELDLGGLAQATSAQAERRAFVWGIEDPMGATSIEELFAPQSANESWSIGELLGHHFDATSTLFAGYAAIGGALGVLSFRGGARLEHDALRVEPVLSSRVAWRFHDLHVAPSAWVGLQPVAMLLAHAAWSYTTDRPRPLELSPNFHSDGTTAGFGNPDLKASRAHNVELGVRLDAEPQQRGSDGAGLIVTYARIADPIRASTVRSGDLSYDNGDLSELWWLEAEADKHFGFIAPWLADAYASVGAAVPIASDERLEGGTVAQADAVAGLDAPEYVLTARVAYDPARRTGEQGIVVALAYQGIGERTLTLSQSLGPDETATPLHLLDFHASYPLGLGFAVSASARNLIDAPIERAYGGVTELHSRLGRTILLGVSFREPD